MWLRHFLVERLRSIPGLGAKLDAGCAVADVGCGCGEAVAVAAAAFPNTTFHGFDISEHALAHASKKAAEMGVKNVDFFNPGVDEGAMGQAAYDVVMTHDAIHDMSHPQDVMDNVCKVNNKKPSILCASEE